MLVIGHRGAKGYEPENTLKSFRRAIALGVDWVELDVWTLEGDSLVFHDHSLSRTTNGHGFIDESSLEYVRSLDAGGGEQVPLLQEVLDCCAGHVRVNIELKGPSSHNPAVAIAQSYIQSGKFTYEDFLFSSFDHSELEACKCLDSTLRIAALLYGRPYRVLQALTELEVYSVHQALEFTSKEFAEEVRRAGFPLYVYTANEEADILRMRDLGIDGVFCDFPDRALRLR
jgi:glycerophosphoryl diester phosphodiesterase